MINPSLALTLLGGSASGGSSTAGDPAAAITALRLAEAPGAETKGVAQEQKDPVTITALKQFQAAVKGARTVQQALSDPRVLNVLLPALGLADQVSYPGLVKQALTADPSASKGLLAALDSRFKAAAQTLDLKNKGLAGLQDPEVIKKLSDGYVTYQYQQGLDKQNPGISDALYFVENAAANANVYTILGNAVLRRVVTGALGLPAEIAVQPVETQARAITSRLDLAKLSDPKEKERLAERYVLAQAQKAGGGTAASPLLSLFA